MRPLRIALQAFGSYAERQVVDFRALGAQRLYLIWGPTGSGKTTLFDAICYALYGVTSGGEREGSQMRSDLASPGTATELTFDFLLGERCYRVRRRPRYERPKQRGEGTTVTEARAWLWQRDGSAESDALVDDGEGGNDGALLAHGARSVTEHVEGLLGFRADQFRQVVLLPQGQFERLLKADSKDRQALLDALFETGLYAQIEEALRRAAKEAREQVEGLRTRHQTIVGEAGRSALHEWEQAVEGLREELSVLGERIAALEGEQRATKQRLRDVDQLIDGRRLFSQLRGEKDQADELLAAAQQRLKKAERTRRSTRDAWKREVRRKGQRQQAARELERLTELSRILSQLAGLQEKDREAQDTVGQSESRLLAARGAVDTAEKRWMRDQAAAIARTLRSGEPCPVCGSKEHPASRSRASGSGKRGPSSADLEEARSGLRRCEIACEEQRRQAAAVQGELARATARAETLAEVLESVLADLPGAGSAKSAKPALLGACDVAGVNAAIQRVEQSIQQLEQDLERAGQAAQRAEVEAATANEQVRGAEEAALALQQRIEEQQREVAERSAQAGFGTIEAAVSHDGRTGGGEPASEPDDIHLEEALRLREQLREAVERARGERDGLLQQHARTQQQLEATRHGLARLRETARALEQADQRYARIGRLADAATGKNPRRITFQRFILATLLEDVLIAASERLGRMTRGRFRLQRSEAGRGGLDLEVSDSSTGTVRSPVTLSGGESFMASLSLALGLADVVQAYSGGVRLDTIFVDEGFGGLDPEALDQALTALAELQHAGKQVGIISHVPELRERIAARLEVTPGPRGSSARLVVP